MIQIYSWVDNNLDDMQTLINEELTEIVPWLKANKLSVNIKKTRYMLLRNLGVSGKDMCLKIDNEVVKQVKKKQFLFVIIGWNLTRKEHISYISAGLLNGWEFYFNPESTWIKPNWWNCIILLFILILHIVTMCGINLLILKFVSTLFSKCLIWIYLI